MKTRHLKNFHFVNEFRFGTVTRLAIAISLASFFSEARDSIQGKYLLINTVELLASADDLDTLSVRFISTWASLWPRKNAIQIGICGQDLWPSFPEHPKGHNPESQHPRLLQMQMFLV